MRNEQKARTVGVSKTGNKWKAYINRLGKYCHLGSYVSKEEALAVRKKAEGISRDDFPEWYAQFVTQRDAQNTRTAGVSKRGDKWSASIHNFGRRYHLGTYVSKEEALVVRKKAEEIGRDDFPEWYAQFVTRRNEQKSSTTGVFKYGNTWRAYIYHLGRRYPLGTFVSKEEALVVRKEVAAISRDNFLEWYAEYLERRGVQQRSRPLGVHQIGINWKANIYRLGKLRYIGCYRTKEEAIAVRKKAEEVSDEDFSEWYNRIRGRLKERQVASYRNRQIGATVSEEELKKIDDKAIGLKLSRAELIVRAVATYCP